MMQLEVRIMEQPYLLNCPPHSEALLHAAAQRVDAVMCRIRDSGKGRVRDRIAVLAALNLAFELEQQPPAAAYASPADNYRLENADSFMLATDALLSSLVARIDAVLVQTSFSTNP